MSGELMRTVQPYVDHLLSYLPGLLKGLVILLVGFWIVKRIDKFLFRFFERKNYDVSLEGFIRSLVNIGLKIIVLFMVAGMIGLPTTSLFAVFGAAGLAIGLALQGSLSNFAGGVLILFFKPFKVGDIVSSLGETGVVKEIQIFNTIMLTNENKTVILPNGSVSNGTIVNVSRHGNLRVDLKISVDFNEDFNKIRSIILDVLSKEKKVLKYPAPTVNILEYAESAVVLAVRPYATPENYWDVQFSAYEAIHQTLLDNGVKGPQIKRISIQG